MFSSFDTDDLTRPLENMAGLSVWLLKVLLVAALAISAASLFWLLLAGPGRDVKVSSSLRRDDGSAQVVVNPDLFQQVDIFKRAARGDAGVSAPVVDAPTTNLKIVLHGVRLSESGNSTATISDEKGVQRTYEVDDEIDGLTSVKIDRIYSDGVLIVRNGKIERLLIRDPSVRALTSIASDEDTEFVPSDVKPSQGPKNVEQPHSASTSIEKPQRFASSMTSADMMRLFQSMSYDATGLDKGVYVFPTRNATLFARSGLKAKDIVVSIGGFQINATTDFKRLLSDIQDEQSTDVDIIRNGRPVLISLRRTDGQSEIDEFNDTR